MLYFFCAKINLGDYMIEKINKAKSLSELLKIVKESEKFTFMQKQEIYNNLKYGSEEYINKFKKEIIELYKQNI